MDTRRFGLEGIRVCSNGRRRPGIVGAANPEASLNPDFFDFKEARIFVRGRKIETKVAHVVSIPASWAIVTN